MESGKPGTARHTHTHPAARGTGDPETGSAKSHDVRILGVGRPVPVSGRRRERIEAIARFQRGLVHRDQLLAAGVTRSAIGRLITSGLLLSRHRNVYAYGHLAPTPLAAETAAVLACGEGAVLSHLTAGLLWEMVREGDGLIHVTTPHRHGSHPKGVTVHRSALLTRGDLTICRRLPITTPEWTILDLADLLDERNLDRALDEALVQRLVSREAVERMAVRGSGRRGAGRLKRAIARHALPQVTRSEAERRLLSLIRAAGLPEPEVNARIAGFEVDFLWRRERLVVEVDGYRFHSSRPAFERDRAKGNRLVAAGLALMRATWWQMEEEPFAVVARIAQAIARLDAA